MKETYREKPRRLFSRCKLNRASIRELCREKGVVDGVSLGARPRTDYITNA